MMRRYSGLDFFGRPVAACEAGMWGLRWRWGWRRLVQHRGDKLSVFVFVISMHGPHYGYCGRLNARVGI